MIYLDHASTTPTDKKVIQAMLPFFGEHFGNPSSLYKLGRRAADVIENSRNQVADIVNTKKEEVFFTAGGTESDNLAIFGIASLFLDNPKKYHLITTQIEHSAVLNSFKALEKKGFEVTYLPVDKFGIVSPQSVMKALKPNTILVSIMYANNEIGTVQPLKEISNILKNYRHIQQVDKRSNKPNYPVLHTDACQAAGYLDLDINKLGVDLMSLNGSKIYGPKQVGALIKRKNIQLKSFLFGGDQERRIRPGTQNVPGIVGFAKALELVEKNKDKENKRLIKLRDYFIDELLKMPETVLNGHHQKRLPNNVNVTFKRIEGESIMLKLDALDIYCSTGSACHSISLDPSHVILAIGQNAEDAHGSMRFTVGKSTTKKDIQYVLKVLPNIIKELRQMTAISSQQ